MYLKEIVTSGFKSFADKLDIKLDGKITSNTNICNKSDIDHVYMVDINNKNIVIVVDNYVYSIEKENLSVKQRLDNVFKIIEGVFISILKS